MGGKHWFFGALLVGGVAWAGSAIAQGPDIGLAIGFPLAPGQTQQSPGQVYNAARANDSTALPPGRLYIQNRTNDPATAVVPGKTFQNYGRSKK